MPFNVATHPEAEAAAAAEAERLEKSEKAAAEHRAMRRMSNICYLCK